MITKNGGQKTLFAVSLKKQTSKMRELTDKQIQDLQTIKDVYAQARGFNNWPELVYKVTGLSQFAELNHEINLLLDSAVGSMGLVANYGQEPGDAWFKVFNIWGLQLLVKVDTDAEGDNPQLVQSVRVNGAELNAIMVPLHGEQTPEQVYRQYEDYTASNAEEFIQSLIDNNIIGKEPPPPNPQHN